MGFDGQADTPPTVVGYRPGQQDGQAIRVFALPDAQVSVPADSRVATPPNARRIEMIDTTPAGDLVVLAGGHLLKGKVFVPPGLPTVEWIVGLLALSLLLVKSA